MSIRVPARAVAAAGIALVLAACGGSGTASSAPTTSTTPSAAASEAPSSTQEPTATPSATEAASASPTSGQTGRVELTDDKVALTLPDGWVTVNLTGDDIDTILGAFPDGTFTDEQIQLMRGAVAAGMRLMAFDSAGTGSNVSVLVQNIAVPMNLLEPTLPAQLKTIPGTSNLDVRKSKALGEDALVASYDLETPMADGSVSSGSGTQLYVSANDRLYVVTVTLLADAKEDPQAIFDSLESLR